MAIAIMIVVMVAVVMMWWAGGRNDVEMEEGRREGILKEGISKKINTKGRNNKKGGKEGWTAR